MCEGPRDEGFDLSLTWRVRIGSLHKYTSNCRAYYRSEGLRDEGFDLGDLRRAGFAIEDVRRAGYAASECRDARPGYTAAECRDGGYGAAELWRLCGPTRRA